MVNNKKQNQGTIEKAEEKEATQQLIDSLKSPPSLGKIKGTLSRREIYTE